jgi:CRISPR/Cas system-associated endonuclease Cas1
MREKMREAITYAKIVENEEKKMKFEEEIINIGIERIKNEIKYDKIKQTRKKNKEMNPTRRSKRIKEKNEVEIIAIKSYQQVLKEKMEKAIEKGDYIDLTI